MKNQQGFSTPVIIGMLTLILLFGGGAYWYFTKDQNVQNENTNVTNTVVSNTSNASTNQTANTNNSSALPKPPEPLATWNSEWRATPITLDAIPSSADAALDECAAGVSELSNNNLCYAEVAVGFRNPLYCEMMDLTEKTLHLTTPEMDLRSCFQTFERQYGMYDCSIHEKVEVRDYCYLTFALLIYVPQPTGDCSQIQDSSLKSSCAEAVTSWQNMRTNLNSTIKEFESSFKEIAAGACAVKANSSLLGDFPTGKILKDFEDLLAFTGSDCEQFITTDDLELARQRITLDEDRDGLNAYLEMNYKTSDKKEDTDGDGYLDLAEINAGYNPNGEGKL